jgi:hypothetical protein
MSYANGNVGIYGSDGILSENQMSVVKNYTGKNIHATAGSRTANTTDLQVGDVLSMDPHGQDTALGHDLANPTATFLDMPLWVVTQVPSGSVRGGSIRCVPLAACHDGIRGVQTKADQTAGVTLLGATDQASASVNQRYLVAVTGSTTNATQIVDNTVKAVAGLTVNTSSTAGRTAVVFPVQ